MTYILIWIITAILYSRVFWDLYTKRWEMVDYTHAYFILPLALLIVWLKRRRLKQLTAVEPPRWSWMGFTALLTGVLLFIFGSRHGYLFLQTISFISVVYGLIRFLHPQVMARELTFPIFYLVLLIPPPMGILDQLTLPMRYATSIISANILHALHYPISREGLLLTLGGHEIFMGAPCSGFRSLITMMALGLFYIYFVGKTLTRKLIFFGSIIPLAMIGNLIRVLTLCLITFYFGEKAGQGFFHNFSGIVVFVIMITGLILIEKILEKFPLPKTAVQPSPIIDDQKSIPPTTRNDFAQKNRWIAAVILLTTLGITCFFSKPVSEEQTILSTLNLPHRLSDWKSEPMPKEMSARDDRYTFINDIFARIYGNRNGQSLLLLVLDAGNFHHPKVCFGSSGFNIKELPDTAFDIGSLQFKAKTLAMKKDAQNYLIIYWICIDKNRVDWTEQKLQQLWFSLWNKQKTGLMVRMDIPVKDDNSDESVKKAQTFIRDFAGALSQEQREYIFGK